MSTYQLPAGYEINADGYGKGYDVVTLTLLKSNGAHLRYMATIDWKRRCFYSGMTMLHKPVTKTKYQGRGWAQQLLDATCRWLEDLSK